jgi:23S rRNA (pseudouridine1915-N3)-methyltransferase
MMTLTLVVVDRARTPFWREGELFYRRRLGRYVHVRWVEVKPTPIAKGRSDEEILREEGKAITRKLPPGDYTVALDRKGGERDSEGLAGWIEKISLRHPSVSFIVGGPLGLSTEVLERANERFSLSALTLTHEMARVVLIEQLYRAFTILRGEKYHK